MASAEIVENGKRIRSALVELVAERGYMRTEVPDLLRRAGVDQATFGRHYPSLEACFADVLDEFRRELVERTTLAFAAQPTWREGMRAISWEFHRFLAEDRDRAQICVIEVNFGGELVQAGRDRFMDICIDAVHLGRLEPGARGDLPRSQAEAIFGAIWERVAAHLIEGEFDRLAEVVPQIMYLIVLPYLGPDAAREELRLGREAVDRHRAGEP